MSDPSLTILTQSENIPLSKSLINTDFCSLRESKIEVCQKENYDECSITTPLQTSQFMQSTNDKINSNHELLLPSLKQKNHHYHNHDIDQSSYNSENLINHEPRSPSGKKILGQQDGNLMNSIANESFQRIDSTEAKIEKTDYLKKVKNETSISKIHLNVADLRPINEINNNSTPNNLKEPIIPFDKPILNGIVDNSNNNNNNANYDDKANKTILEIQGLSNESNSINQRSITPIRYSKMTEEEAAHVFENRRKELLDTLRKANLEKKNANKANNYKGNNEPRRHKKFPSCYEDKNTSVFNSDGKLNMNNFIIFSNNSKNPIFNEHFTKRDYSIPNLSKSMINKNESVIENNLNNQREKNKNMQFFNNNGNNNNNFDKRQNRLVLNTEIIPHRKKRERSLNSMDLNLQMKQQYSYRSTVSRTKSISTRGAEEMRQLRRSNKKILESKGQFHSFYQPQNDKDNNFVDYSIYKDISPNIKSSYKTNEHSTRFDEEHYKQSEEKTTRENYSINNNTPKKKFLMKNHTKSVKDRLIVDVNFGQTLHSSKIQEYSPCPSSVKSEFKKSARHAFRKSDDSNITQSKNLLQNYTPQYNEQSKRGTGIGVGTGAGTGLINFQKKNSISSRGDLKNVNGVIKEIKERNLANEKIDKSPGYQEQETESFIGDRKKKATSSTLQENILTKFTPKMDKKLLLEKNKPKQDIETSLFLNIDVTPKKENPQEKSKLYQNESKTKNAKSGILMAKSMQKEVANNKPHNVENTQEIKYDPEGFYKKKIEWLKKKAESKRQNDISTSFSTTEMKIQPISNILTNLDESTNPPYMSKSENIDNSKIIPLAETRMIKSELIGKQTSNETITSTTPDSKGVINQGNKKLSNNHEVKVKKLELSKLNSVEQGISNVNLFGKGHVKTENGLQDHILQSYALLENLQSMITGQKSNTDERTSESNSMTNRQIDYTYQSDEKRKYTTVNYQQDYKSMNSSALNDFQSQERILFNSINARNHHSTVMMNDYAKKEEIDSLFQFQYKPLFNDHDQNQNLDNYKDIKNNNNNNNNNNESLHNSSYYQSEQNIGNNTHSVKTKKKLERIIAPAHVSLNLKDIGFLGDIIDKKADEVQAGGALDQNHQIFKKVFLLLILLLGVLLLCGYAYIDNYTQIDTSIHRPYTQIDTSIHRPRLIVRSKPGSRLIPRSKPRSRLIPRSKPRSRLIPRSKPGSRLRPRPRPAF